MFIFSYLSNFTSYFRPSTAINQTSISENTNSREQSSGLSDLGFSMEIDPSALFADALEEEDFKNCEAYFHTS